MEDLILAMRTTLGTAFALYVALHGAHWNVEGPDFYQLHKLLEDQYTEVWESLDDIAEHIRALDAYAPQCLGRFMELSRLSELPPAPFNTREVLVALVGAQELMITVLNEAIDAAKAAGEEGIVNFLGGRVEAHQKQRWMLRASAKPQRH